MFLFRTQKDFAILFVRLALGVSMLAHGLEKLGVFRDADPDKGLFQFADSSAAAVASMAGVPAWMGWLAIAAEVLGAASLIFGFFGRFCALAIGGVMVMAAWKVGAGPDAEGVMQSLQNGAFEAWWRSTPGSYHILAIGAALAILVRGSGSLSIDRFMTRRD
jgi:uncharacterized membrane protein YphA (DoxX/SURF4 family)